MLLVLQLLRERQLAAHATDSHDTGNAPLVGNHVSSISADSRGHLCPVESPGASSLASPVSQIPAQSLGSLLQLDPVIAAISKDFESKDVTYRKDH